MFGVLYNSANRLLYGRYLKSTLLELIWAQLKQHIAAYHLPLKLTDTQRLA